MTFLFRLTYAFPLLSFAVVSQEEQSKRSRPRMGAYNLVDEFMTMSLHSLWFRIRSARYCASSMQSP